MRYIIALLFFFCSFQIIAQEDLLAKNYFDKGEYEKALLIYEKLYNRNKGSFKFLMNLVKTLQQLEEFTEAEKLLQIKLSNSRVLPQLYVELGYNHALQDQDSLALANYNKAINFIREKPIYAYNIGKTFSDYGLLQQAVDTYELSMEIDNTRDYTAQLARLYGEMGQLEKMFETYINLVLTNPGFNASARRNFRGYINEDPNNEANILLRKILLRRLQNDPDILYNQFLSWLFIQQKDFRKAFIQEKAIFIRADEDLTGMRDLANITIDEEAYNEARDIVNFIIDNANNKALAMDGHRQLMAIELKLTPAKDYNKIEAQFQELFTQYGTERDTYLLQLDYNSFLAYDYEKKEDAIANLRSLTQKNLSTYQEARVKLKLADILVFDEKFNEALIYYSQVQNKVKNDRLAQQARFKVAQTSYFKGDFEWAQTQLDVLKKSASQLIANDAMQLSLMIRDNSLEDSTQTALKKFAKADLRKLQKRYSDAKVLLEDILLNHKGEKIEDEALFTLAKVYEAQKNFENAAETYKKLIEFYNKDILADDAYYYLAKLYDGPLDNTHEAKQYYEQIIFDFADSIYFVEARKRYRLLRGDALN